MLIGAVDPAATKPNWMAVWAVDPRGPTKCVDIFSFGRIMDVPYTIERLDGLAIEVPQRVRKEAIGGTLKLCVAIMEMINEFRAYARNTKAWLRLVPAQDWMREVFTRNKRVPSHAESVKGALLISDTAIQNIKTKQAREDAAMAYCLGQWVCKTIIQERMKA